MKCNNCNAELSCGCQQRVANDKKMCCVNCVHDYNNKLSASQQNLNQSINYEGVNINNGSSEPHAPIISSVVPKYNNFNP